MTWFYTYLSLEQFINIYIRLLLYLQVNTLVCFFFIFQEWYFDGCIPQVLISRFVMRNWNYYLSYITLAELRILRLRYCKFMLQFGKCDGVEAIAPFVFVSEMFLFHVELKLGMPPRTMRKSMMKKTMTMSVVQTPHGDCSKGDCCKPPWWLL